MALIGGLILSLAALVYLASINQPWAHMAVSAATALLVALVAIRENRELHATGASKNVVSASTSRHMTGIWLWGAAGLLITYALVLYWPEWWKFCLAFAGLGAVTGFMGYQSARDEAAGKLDKGFQ
jgi:FtsH-binding integral membrane protein